VPRSVTAETQDAVQARCQQLLKGFRWFCTMFGGKNGQAQNHVGGPLVGDDQPVETIEAGTSLVGVVERDDEGGPVRYATSGHGLLRSSGR